MTKGDKRMTFAQLNMNQNLLTAITKGGYTTPTPIQIQAIPHILKGKDLLGSAQTGTGKTAAFALPIIQRLHENSNPSTKKQPRALVLAPTRELALQIKDSFHTYGKHSPIKTTAIYGGVPKRRQIQAIKRGVDVVIATPGRLLDLLNMKIFTLDMVEYYVLDEADRMLDMGFIHDVKEITSKLPFKHQTMLFSATLPKSILQLSKTLLNQPVRIEISKDNTPLETVNQSVYFVKKANKVALLKEVLKNESVTSALVFVRTKQGANRLTKSLNEAGVLADAIHGNKSQSHRQRTLKEFKQGKHNILIATDVASRGIDIDALSHVINYDLPETPETYLHRIGRTARAGRLGRSLSFCSPEESHLLKAIQQHIEMTIPVEANHGFKLERPKPTFKKNSAISTEKNAAYNNPSKRKKKHTFKHPTKKNKGYKSQTRGRR